MSEKDNLFYGCIACGEPIVTYGICERCVPAYSIGLAHGLRGGELTSKEVKVEKPDKPRGKIIRNMDTPESREFWEKVERSAALARELPAWARMGI